MANPMFKHQMPTEVLKDRLADMTADRDRWKALARLLYRPGLCEIDSDGNCQEHLWFPSDTTQSCPDGRAQALFNEDDEKGTTA